MPEQPMRRWPAAAGSLLAVVLWISPAAAAERAHPELWDALQMRTADAAAEITAAYEADPEDAELMMLRALVLRGEGDLEEADELAEEALEVASDVAEFHSLKAEIMAARIDDVGIFRKLGYAKQMLEHFERAVELAPEDIDAREELMGYYINAPGIAGGDREAAEAQVAAIREMDPARGELARARIHLSEEEPDQALAAIGRALELDPDDPELMMRVGFMYQGLRRWDDAFRTFETVLELVPDHVGATYQIGRTAVFSESRLERGREALERYMGLDPSPDEPTHADAQWRLGLLTEVMGETAVARQHYEKALELRPGHPQAEASLADLD